MYFKKKNEHTVQLFINANLLPLNFLYYKALSELMQDIRNTLALPNILCNLFTNMSTIHSYKTRSATSNNFYIKRSRLEIQKRAFSRMGAKLWNDMPASEKTTEKLVQLYLW